MHKCYSLKEGEGGDVEECIVNNNNNDITTNNNNNYNGNS